MKMEQNISFDNISPLKVKNLFSKLCLMSHGYAEKGHYTQNAAEKALRAKIKQLEEDLKQVKKEKDKALIENRNRINELNIELLSVKTSIKELLHYKREKDRRLRNLEKKILKTVK